MKIKSSCFVLKNEALLTVIIEYEVEYLLDKVIIDCKDKNFHSFEYRSIYDIRFTNLII